ncbi:MAG: site-specific integrase [Candidatus Nitrosopolaris sp.]
MKNAAEAISQEKRREPDSKEQCDPLFDRKIDSITSGIRREYSRGLHEISKENALTIADYILAMRTETNLCDHYRMDLIKLLFTFSKYINNKPFMAVTRNDLISFLESFRKSEASDPMHKWIGTYNTYRTHLLRFFKWLYYSDIEPAKRCKPQVIENIPQLKRKEQSIYKPTDMWTAKEDALFLKYCPTKRMKCYHAVSRDTACRPHELLKLKIKDIVFKSAAANKQYAEVLVNGKTGSRHIPLIDSIPYVKDYLGHEHQQPGNPNAVFFCGNGKSLGRSLEVTSLNKIYFHYKKDFFPKLLDNPNVPPDDKQGIKELLTKPWNPYIRRHSSLTEKAKILKEPILKMHAGWSPRSQTHLKYEHYYGNESCESILEAYGIITKDQKIANSLRPKECPNCNEPNKPDSRFCAKCRMVLTYDAYSETVEEIGQKDNEIQNLKQQMMSMQESQKEILDLLKDPVKLIEALKAS